MNGDVAAGALTARLEPKPAVRRLSESVKSCMALQTELSALAANEKHPVGGAVRVVAPGAAFHLGGRMLVNERAPLFDVALNAGFRGSFDQARRIERAVRTVTVGALHQSLRDAMVHRKSELPANGCVARVAEVRLCGFQETVL